MALMIFGHDAPKGLERYCHTVHVFVLNLAAGTFGPDLLAFPVTAPHHNKVP